MLAFIPRLAHTATFLHQDTFGGNMPRRDQRRRRRPRAGERGSLIDSPYARRLAIEQLEDRRLLATITVDSEADNTTADTELTLREATLLVNEAGDAATALGRALTVEEAAQIDDVTEAFGTNDTIEFDATLSGQTILLGGSHLEIFNPVRVDAAALDENVTIDAQQDSRIFYISSFNGNMTIAGLTLTGGSTVGEPTSKGGAIYHGFTGLSDLTISECMIIGNTSETGGGGIYSSRTMTITDSNISDNDTTYGNGGGIRSRGLTLINSVVSGNSAVGGTGGGIYCADFITLSGSTVSGNSSLGNGGGILVGVRTEFTLTDSTVSGNSTTGHSAHGGGISAGRVTLINSAVSGNSTTGDNSKGGGIFASTLTLTASRVSGNSTAGATAAGGGMFVSSGGVMATDSTISGNSTTGNDAEGGAFFSSNYVMLIWSTVSGNSTMGSGANGGGISTGGTLTLMQSTVNGNSTMGSAANGGGISTGGTLMLMQSTVSGNSTMGSAANGGGVSVGDSLMLTQSTVSGNSTSGENSHGGGIYAEADATFTNSTVANNHAIHATATGGGIWNDDQIVISSSIVADNTAAGGMPDINPGTGSLDVDYSLIEQIGLPLIGVGNTTGIDPLLGPLADKGGPTQVHELLLGSPAIDAGDPSIVFDALQFDQRGNPFLRVAHGGVAGLRADMGAVESQALPGLSLVVDTPIDENDGDYSTGDFSLREAIGLANGSIGANTISFSAAMFATPQTSLLKLGEMVMNDAVTLIGPGQQFLTIDAQEQSRIFNITADTGDFAISGLTLTGGKTTDSSFLGAGGAIRSDTTFGNLTIADSTISDSSSGESGGGISSRGHLTLTNSIVSGNSATGEGGGVSAIDLTISDSMVIGNSTTLLGGGINAFVVVSITNSTVSDNSAGSAGGGIVSSPSFHSQQQYRQRKLC